MEKSPLRRRGDQCLPPVVASVKTILISRGHTCDTQGVLTERSASNPRSTSRSPTPTLPKGFLDSSSFPSPLRQVSPAPINPQTAKFQVSSCLSHIASKHDYENLRHSGLINTSRFLRTHTNLPAGIAFKPMSSAGKNKFVPYFQQQIGISLRMLRRREAMWRADDGTVTERLRPAGDVERQREKNEKRKSPMLRRAFRKVENLYRDRPFSPDTMEALVIRSRSPVIPGQTERESETEKERYKRPKSRM